MTPPKQKKTMRRLAVALLAVLVIAAGIAVAIVPTYTYHGETLGIPEFLRLIDSGYTVHCLQLSGIIGIRYACFDTSQELDAYSASLHPAQE